MHVSGPLNVRWCKAGSQSDKASVQQRILEQEPFRAVFVCVPVEDLVIS